MIIDSELDNRKIQTFEYETTAISDGKIIGTCELGKAEIQMLNSSNEYSSLKGQWINTIHGSFYIYNVEPVQEKVSIKLSCYDIKYKLDTPYDSSLYTSLFPCTLKQWRNAIFTNLGLTYDDSDFPNSNLILTNQPYIKDGASNRDVQNMIAEAGCSWIETDSTDKFYFRWFEDVTYQVSDWLELTTEKETTSAINTVVLGRGDVENNVYCPTTLPENPIEFRIDNNYILDPQDTTSSTDLRYVTILPIYQRVNGFSYLKFSMRSQTIDNKLSIKLGQKVSYKDIWNNNLTAYIMTKKISYLGGDQTLDKNYEITLSADDIKESSTDYSYGSSVQNDILKVSRKADMNEGKIEDLVSKTIITANIVNSIGQVQLENAHEGILHKLSISGQISLLFPQSENNLYGYPLVPSDDLVPSNTLTPSSPVPYGNEVLYPSSTLYPRGSILLIDDVEYMLDFDFLNYLSATVFDEFVYKDGECWIIRRVGIDSQGNKYALNKEVTELREPINLEVKSDSIIKLKSFNSAIYSVEYLLENEYTDVFATQVDVQSQITQTNNKIEATVSQVADENGEVTAGSILLAVNKDESQAKIQADKIALEGYTTINGNFKVDEDGNMEANNGKLNNVNIEDGSIIINNGQYSTASVFELNSTEDGSYLHMYSDRAILQSKKPNVRIDIRVSDEDGNTPSLKIFSADTATYIYSGAISTDYVTAYTKCSSAQFENLSLAEKKKNFELLKSGLDIIKNIDIYKYHYKDLDLKKKKIGFVIGKDFKYSEEVTSENNDGVDLYSFVSVCCKAIQEQQEEIENLKKEMEELKNGFNRISK